MVNGVWKELLSMLGGEELGVLLRLQNILLLLRLVRLTVSNVCSHMRLLLYNRGALLSRGGARSVKCSTYICA